MFYNMMSLLFVTVMTIGSEHIYMNFCLKAFLKEAGSLRFSLASPSLASGA